MTTRCGRLCGSTRSPEQPWRSPKRAAWSTPKGLVAPTSSGSSPWSPNRCFALPVCRSRSSESIEAMFARPAGSAGHDARGSRVAHQPEDRCGGAIDRAILILKFHWPTYPSNPLWVCEPCGALDAGRSDDGSPRLLRQRRIQHWALPRRDEPCVCGHERRTVRPLLFLSLADDGDDSGGRRIRYLVGGRAGDDHGRSLVNAWAGSRSSGSGRDGPDPRRGSCAQSVFPGGGPRRNPNPGASWQSSEVGTLPAERKELRT